MILVMCNVRMAQYTQKNMKYADITMKQRKTLRSAHVVYERRVKSQFLYRTTIERRMMCVYFLSIWRVCHCHEIVCSKQLR